MELSSQWGDHLSSGSYIHRRVARVVFGDALLDVVHEIGADVGGHEQRATNPYPTITLSMGIAVELTSGVNAACSNTQHV
ncbi:hypothetical protein H257_04774 [Aphanomyces astaci]|uniref:Uncharacterized protein n=1 Tax=Aphanomyces astaci TaxID=112090 RepID=W4GTJ0_APHAT|nr:hypothetical protein H257_04774 [Aphanomyces astaci]ETV83032.1 hypothetical protein H257_04774 [Aphanomyces astaci]|eukprot:XP_009827703.1 hypothetical protein H257_04774 [Aphanomyces astaci]